MQATEEQSQIINSRAHRLRVIALAGTGKTSTLRMLAEARSDERMLYLAFNRSIANEVGNTFPRNVTAKTTHALALSTMRGRYRDQIGNMRTWELADRLGLSFTNPALRTRFARYILETLQAWFNSADDILIWKHLPEVLKLDRDSRSAIDRIVDEKAVLADAECTWRLMRDPVHTDFPIPHDGYLKAFCLSEIQLPFDTILLDEAQDTNAAMLELLKVQKARLVFVGDPYQSIYSWRGAVDAMESPADETLYLTGSFRFGEDIARVADATLRWINPEMPQLRGLGPRGRIDGIYKGKQLAVLGRTNEGLFDMAARLVLARPDAELGFLGGIESYGFSVLEQIYQLLVPGMQPNDPEIARFDSFEDLQDYADHAGDVVLKVRAKLVEKYGKQIPDLLDRMRKADAGPEALNLFSTVHKAKGGQMPQVIICEDFIEMMDGSRPVDLAREANRDKNPESVWENARLRYVACTRAQFALRLDSSCREYMAYLKASNTGRDDGSSRTAQATAAR